MRTVECLKDPRQRWAKSRKQIKQCLVVPGKVKCWHYYRVPSKLSMVLVATVKSAAMKTVSILNLSLELKREIDLLSDQFKQLGPRWPTPN